MGNPSRAMLPFFGGLQLPTGMLQQMPQQTMGQQMMPQQMMAQPNFVFSFGGLQMPQQMMAQVQMPQQMMAQAGAVADGQPQSSQSVVPQKLTGSIRIGDLEVPALPSRPDDNKKLSSAFKALGMAWNPRSKARMPEEIQMFPRGLLQLSAFPNDQGYSNARGGG